MTKQTLRKYWLEKRLALSATERSKIDDLLLIKFQQWGLPSFVETVLSYWPMAQKAEPNTFLLTGFLAFRLPSLRLAYPVSDLQTNRLVAFEVSEDSLYKNNALGITEPAGGEELSHDALDLIIVPLLTFDRLGHRLGYGKGFYDRYLSKCRPDTIKLGISYFDAIEELPEKTEYDLPLTACITPEKIYEF
jgi:5-formyltetrahydrofolate cyclo-ligase